MIRSHRSLFNKLFRLSALLPAAFGWSDLQATLHIQGTTATGLQLNGTLTGLSGSMLYLAQPRSGTFYQVGIPLTGDLDIQITTSAKDIHLEELEACAELIPFLSTQARESFMDLVMPLAIQSGWEIAYIWADRFVKSSKSEEVHLQASLLRCQALYQLGQFQQLNASLSEINKIVQPMEAPALLCWLNAVARPGSGDTFFWASLPFLRIPAYDGPLLDSLKKLLDSPDVYPPIQGEISVSS